MDVVEGAVQILTAHAAKGLEWDVVSVAGLSKGVWPGLVRGSDHFLGGIGVLPFPLRGDASGLPELNLDEAVEQKDVNAALSEFGREWREHDVREERRLAYVAMTRPRRLLLCSGYWWGDGVKRPRGPSVFLDEVRATCAAGAGVVAAWTPEPAPGETNPSDEVVSVAEWPADPLGLRRPAMAAAADLIRRMIANPDASAAAAFADLAAENPEVAARAGLAADLAGLAPADQDPDPDWVRTEHARPDRNPERSGLLAAATAADRVTAVIDPDVARWRKEARLLLAERAERTRRDGPIEVALPPHLSVSQLVVLRRDPQALARSLRRPLPQRPAPHARRGTAFHVWLEQRFGAARLIDIDELPGAADDSAAGDEELAALQEAFLTGEWADRTPLDVEVPFATTVGGVVVRGRMDAVFADPDNRFDVIDWKTGRRPTGAEAEAAAVQLSAYRIAWATLAGVPVHRVRAGFHYVREQVTVRPADLMDVAALTALLTEIPEEAL